MVITRVEVRAVGPTVTRYTWSHDIPEQFMTNTIVRIYTDEGLAGTGAVANYTSYDYDNDIVIVIIELSMIVKINFSCTLERTI